jgi:hypothetical protein
MLGSASLHPTYKKMAKVFFKKPGFWNTKKPDFSTGDAQDGTFKQRGSGKLAFSGSLGNQKAVFLQNSTNINITGTSIKTPTTVAKAAPEFKPNKVTAVAIATSK